MQKKILLKTAREYLQSSFPENLLPTRKLRQNEKKSTLQKIRNLKIQVIRAKNEVFKQYANFAKRNFYTSQQPTVVNPIQEKKQGLVCVSKDNLVLNNNVTFYNPQTFLVNPTFRNKGYFTPSEAYNKNQQITSPDARLLQTKFVIEATPRVPPFLFALDQIQHELAKRKVRSSDFKNQLKERKKLALIYGQLSKKYIKKTIKQASLLSGKKSDNFFFLLEKRLDIVLFRACFFPSIKSARQWINHNKILVNSQFINTCSYTLKPGDIISIKQKDRIVLCKKITHFLKKKFFKENKTNTKQFVISMSLFQKLKSSLNLLGMTQSFISTLNEQNDFSTNLSDTFKQNKGKLQTKFVGKLQTKFVGKLQTKFVGKSQTKFVGFVPKVSAQQKLMAGSRVGVSSISKLSYEHFLLEVKQILRFKLKEYSNNGKNLSSNLQMSFKSKFSVSQKDNRKNLAPIRKDTNSFASGLSQVEKTVLRKNLVGLDLIQTEVLFLSEKPHFIKDKVSNLEKTSLRSLRGFLTHLKLKKLFSLNDKKVRNFPILHQNTWKPLHLEISYKNLVIIYLYSPQKMALPCSVDMGLIVRSLA